MNDIRPPQKKLPQKPTQPSINQPPVNPPVTPTVTTNTRSQSPPQVSRAKKFYKTLVFKLAVGSIMVVIALAVAGVLWYNSMLRPKDSARTDTVAVTVDQGARSSDIAQTLYEKEVISSKVAFELYLRLTGKAVSIQAGQHQVSPSMSAEEIVDTLSVAQTKHRVVTFYPGATVYDPSEKNDKKRTDVYTMLIRAGFDEDEVTRALKKQYDHPLLASKPKNVGLDGYIYGETYHFDRKDSVEDVLMYVFTYQHNILKAMNFEEKMKARGLTLHEGLTLASIVQREVSNTKDQAQVAQVFWSRLDSGMQLGSDVTFIYAARQNNDTPSVGYESPYNTRKYAGLPPGPIANPSKNALEATANPASGDYLFFVAGDNGTTYFSKTVQQHEAYAKQYCIELCKDF